MRRDQDLSSPGGDRRNKQPGVIARTVIATLLTAVAAWLTWVTVPRFRHIFNDFDVALPRPTEFLLGFAWVIVIPALLALAAGVVSLACVSARRLAHHLAGGFVVVEIVLLALAIWSLFLPFARLTAAT